MGSEQCANVFHPHVYLIKAWKREHFNNCWAVFT